MLQPLQITIKIFVCTYRQKFDAVCVENSIRKQAQLVRHAKFVNTNASKIAYFLFADSCISCHSFHRSIEIILL